MSLFTENLKAYLERRGLPGSFSVLTPDASTREYFRISYDGKSAIACAYPEAFDPGEQSYLDVTALFENAGLPVARVLDFDADFGIIVQEDFGDRILRDVLLECDEASRNAYLDRAIRLIAEIQAATDLARERNSIASRLSFDFEKLSWELDFFTEHYFSTLRKSPLSESQGRDLKHELDAVAAELAGRATVLTHRDFHAANLMLDHEGGLRIIDHQDARMGSVAYDLVSLLLDRVTELPSPEWLGSKRRLLMKERTALGLPDMEEAEFAHEFRLQTVQRCLKAIGTFSFQSAVRGKTHFLPFIGPMFGIVLRAATNLGGFPTLSEVIEKELSSDR